MSSEGRLLPALPLLTGRPPPAGPQPRAVAAARRRERTTAHEAAQRGPVFAPLRPSGGPRASAPGRQLLSTAHADRRAHPRTRVGRGAAVALPSCSSLFPLQGGKGVPSRTTVDAVAPAKGGSKSAIADQTTRASSRKPRTLPSK
ncbi:hypothetical protein MTO96_020559 [Rhipicephalus appendiculatus]